MNVLEPKQDLYHKIQQFKYLFCWEYSNTIIKNHFKGQKINLSSISLTEKQLRYFYNPLKKKQDIIFLNSDTDYMCLNYDLFRLLDTSSYEEVSMQINTYLADLPHEQQILMVSLIQYSLTKNVNNLAKLAQQSLHFNLHAFKLCDKLFEDGIFNLGQLHELSKTLFNNIDLKHTFYPLDHLKPHNNKNVIVIHLESISNEIYSNHQKDLPMLRYFLNKSLYLSKFYSSATSSAMAIADFLYGNSSEIERFINFEDICLEYSNCKNLYQILSEYGYDTLGIGYNKIIKTEEVNKFKSWNVNGTEYIWKDNYKEFKSNIVDFIKTRTTKPFAMHIWNLITHIGHKNNKTDYYPTFSERMTVSYELLNDTIETVYNELVRADLLENTILVFYGDHGDDKWTREIGSGYTHIIEPYMNVIATPACIYDTSLQPDIYSEPVSLIDLKKSILHLLGISIESTSQYEGINIFHDYNNYVYARNLLINQYESEHIKNEEMIRLNNFRDTDRKNKAFAIIDAKYNLVADKDGIELFLHTIDPGNYCNLLQFFDFNDKYEFIKFNNLGAWKGHFRNIMMVDAQIYEILEAYYRLKNNLSEWIQHKKRLASCSGGDSFPLECLDKIKGRKKNAY